MIGSTRPLDKPMSTTASRFDDGCHSDQTSNASGTTTFAATIPFLQRWSVRHRQARPWMRFITAVQMARCPSTAVTSRAGTAAIQRTGDHEMIEQSTAGASVTFERWVGDPTILHTSHAKRPSDPKRMSDASFASDFQLANPREPPP